MTKHPLIALDIGNVCVRLYPERYARYFGFHSHAEIPAEFRRCCMQLEIGKITHDEWLQAFRKQTGGRFTGPELIAGWNSMLGETMPGMTEAVRKFTETGVRFVYFSNTSKEHMDTFFAANDFSHLVTGAVFSYEAGVLKPDPAMYQFFENRFGVPDLYFDDRAENVESALGRNWRGIVFTSAEQFEKTVTDYLKERDLL